MAGTKRNSNIELLRIVAMFMIVCGHFISQSGLKITGETACSYLLLLIGSGSRIATNIFLIIGVWFMVDSKFSPARITKIYWQTAFYTWLLTLISVICFLELCSMKDIARGMMPLLGRALWFVSAYITLMLFIPMLNKVLDWDRNVLRLTVILLLFFVSFICTLPDTQDSYVLDSLWFLVVYLTIGYMKKYPLTHKISALTAIFGGGAYMLHW